MEAISQLHPAAQVVAIIVIPTVIGFIAYCYFKMLSSWNMTKTTYTLLIRDNYPIVRYDGTRSKNYNWIESDTHGSLKRIRKAEDWFKKHGEKTKIIREELKISVVKKGDLK